jgi:hypothetical protein
VLELVATDVAFVTIAGDERAAASVERLDGVVACPVAPDERLIAAPVDALEQLVTIARERATTADPDALVVDTTDGWAVWTLQGDGVRAAFSRLSGVRLPGRGFTQGDVTRVPVKLIVERDRLHLIVPAMWRSYLHDRIVERCRSLGLTERAGLVPFAVSGEQ